MQSNGKNLSEFMQGDKIPALMQELGFECFQTAMMCNGMKCVVYQKMEDPGNRWRIEVGINCKINAWDWNEEKDGWGFRFGCEINPGFIDNLQHWILILHLSGAITVSKLISLVNQNTDHSLFNLFSDATIPNATGTAKAAEPKISIPGFGLTSNALKMVEA